MNLSIATSTPIFNDYTRAQQSLRSAASLITPKCGNATVGHDDIATSLSQASKAVELLTPYAAEGGFGGRAAAAAIPVAQQGIEILKSVLNPPANARLDIARMLGDAAAKFGEAHSITGWE